MPSTLCLAGGNNQSGAVAPAAFADYFDDSNWIDIQDANTQKYSKRVNSKKKTHAKRKQKNTKLDCQVFEGIFNDAKKMADEADMALRIARGVNDAKEAVRYKGTHHEKFEENIIARVEDLVAVTVGLSTAQSIPAALSLIHLYLRTHYPQPVSKRLMGICSNLLDESKKYVQSMNSKNEWVPLDNQSLEEDYDKIKEFRNLIKSWKSHRNCDLSRNIANVVNILVTFGFLPDWEEDPLQCGDFTLFTARVWDVQKDSMSFVDMVLDTASFFLERGYAALVAKDLSLLLYSDSDAAALEAEYSLLVSALPLLEAGRLIDLRSYNEEITDDQDFEVRLEALIATIFQKLKSETSQYIRNTLNNKLVILKKVRVALIMSQKSSCIREKPFGVLVYGGSAVGKSAINATLLKVLLHHNGFNSSKEHVVTLNDSDKFQSEYRACHSAVTMDDFGNTRAEHYDGSPTNKIIDFLNNVPKAALNPNVELKGNVMIQPKIVTVTTNKKDLMAHNFSNEPVSILRRFDVVLDVRVKSDCVDPETGGVDPKKMSGFVPDVWEIDMQRVKIIRGHKDAYEFKTLLKNASLFDCLELMKEMSVEHFELQKKFVDHVEKMYEQELCPHSYVPEECPHCKLDTQCLFEPLGEFDTADPAILKQVNATLNHLSPNPVERLTEHVADWYLQRKCSQAQAWIAGSCSTLQEAFQKHKQEILQGTLATLGIATLAYAGFQAYKRLRNVEEMISQGCEEKPPTRLDTDVPNPWKKVSPTYINKTIVSRTTTVDQLSDMIAKHMAHATIVDHDKGTQRKCDIVPLKGNVWLLPTHMLADRVLDIYVQTTPKDVLGKNFNQKIDPTCWVSLDGDFSLVRLVNGGDVKPLFKYLPVEDFTLTSKVFVKILHKDEEGYVSRDSVPLLSRRQFTSLGGTFEGVDYHYPRPTLPGLCMSPLVCLQKAPVIMGFHLAGRNGESYGAAGVLLQSQFLEGLSRLDAKYPLAAHSSGELLTNKFDVDFTPDCPISVKHSVNWLADDDVDGQQPLAEVLGAHPKGTARFVSQVRKSPISDAVTEVMQLPRLHGKPNTSRIGRHWARDLNLMSHPKGNFVPSILKAASDDLMQHIDNLLDSKPELLDIVHPYPKDYVLSGMDGVTSVDRVELNSSMGFPINKKKKNFLAPVDRVVEGITEVIDFEDPQYWAEVERMERVLASGERVFAIHRGNLKDEPTKYTKDKIRVFAGCEFAFTCLVRKYYLSIVRLIQGNGTDFECAVGINAHGKDWGRLKEHLIQYGDERMIAGDYKAFDKAATPLAMMTSFEMLIHIADRAGYTQEQLTIMRGIATEICYPLYELDGILVQIFGSNPSGHPLTVIINNLENSLYLRYAYYAMHKDEIVPAFADRIALLCYGDDNAMGVHELETKFNHTSVASELDQVGITYTMADKEAESVPYIPLKDVSFLKRGFVYSSAVDSIVAPIEVASISKSLHNFMHNKGSDVLPAQIAAQAINAANMEFFYHGKEVFEERRAQLLEVAELSGISDFVGELDTHADLIDRYNNSRIKKSILEEPKILDC